MKSSMNKILRLLLLTLFISTSTGLLAQEKSFEKYADMKDVTYVFISKTMLSLAGVKASPKVPGMKMDGIMNKLTGIQIITTDNRSMRKKLKTDVKSVIANDDFETLMAIDDEDGAKINIYLNDGKKKSIIIMVTDSDDQVSVIVFSGTFTAKDIEKLTEKNS